MAPAPQTRKGPLVPLLAAGCAVLLVVSIVFAVLWIVQGNELDDTAESLRESSSTVSDQEVAISDLDDQVAELNDTVSRLEDELAVAQGDAAAAQDLQACLDSLSAYFEAVEDDASESKLDDLWEEFGILCGPYL